MRSSWIRRCVIAFSSAAVLAAGASSSAAFEKEYPADGDHPLRIAYYFVYPAGKLLELGVTRPLWSASRYFAPYEHIGERGFSGCARERPARSCTNVVK